jgi:hypothetical protein
MPGVRNVELVLVGAIVLAGPSLLQAFSGGMAVATALVHLALALALCWAAGAVVERVIDSYSREARRREFANRLAQLAEARARLVQQARAETERR